ncbi:MAG TPA: radical SAM protein [Ruminococcaceae bacterium]|nr:radical SAM protein [Oscillospiraceae bacterium]
MSNIHSNISIFVPHIGCPNMCSFCNQRYITGKNSAPTAENVDEAVQTALSSSNYNPETTEIAFFGGSFTAINHNYMITLLNSAFKYVHKGLVSGIRISTRPDAIDRGILTILKSYGVTAIEIGAQSMNDKVLKKNNRGHTAKDVQNAAKLIKELGFSLGIQMMTGLYGDNNDQAIKTAKEIAKLKPDTVRIYPTVVLKDTDLAALYADGFYKPQNLDDAVDLATELLCIFENANIRVIRLGLHSIEPDSYIAGPWHPAFSELCISNLFFSKAKKLLGEKGDYILYVSPSSVSKMTGQKRINIKKFHELGYNCTVKKDSKLKGYEIIAERVEEL